MKSITNITHDSAWKASFCYDVNGNMVRQCSPMVTNTYAYDCMNRMTSTTQRILSTTYSVSFQYDANGNRTNITYYPNYSVGYSYDAENRLEQVRGNSASQVLHFGYDGAGRLTELSYFNGITNQINYDANGQITRLQHGTFIDRQMVRDARGFVTSVAIQSGFPPPSPYACDNAYAYNAADRMTGHNSSGECGSDETSYTFNPNGCLSSTVQASQTNTYTYDFNNRFLSASFVSGDVLSVCYDAAGTRVGVATTDGWHFFITDPIDPYKRPLVEYTDQGAPVRYYMWAGNRLLYHHDAAGLRCYHPDEQGSTLALSDDSGNVTDQFAYLPYGAAVHIGATKTPFQWLGGYGVYYDGDSELHLTLHRAYSAKDKRFLQPDPIGLNGGPNLYWYGDGNPLKFVDPLGLFVGNNTFWNRVDSRIENGWNGVKNTSDMIQNQVVLSAERFANTSERFVSDYLVDPIEPHATALSEAAADHVANTHPVQLVAESIVGPQIPAAIVGVYGTLLPVAAMHQQAVNRVISITKDFFDQSGPSISYSFQENFSKGGSKPAVWNVYQRNEKR